MQFRADERDGCDAMDGDHSKAAGLRCGFASRAPTSSRCGWRCNVQSPACTSFVLGSAPLSHRPLHVRLLLNAGSSGSCRKPAHDHATRRLPGRRHRRTDQRRSRDWAPPPGDSTWKKSGLIRTPCSSGRSLAVFGPGEWRFRKAPGITVNSPVPSPAPGLPDAADSGRRL